MSAEITLAGAITGLIAEKRALGYKYVCEERAQATHASTDARVTVSRPGNALAQNASKRASARSSQTYL